MLLKTLICFLIIHIGLLFIPNPAEATENQEERRGLEIVLGLAGGLFAATQDNGETINGTYYPGEHRIGGWVYGLELGMRWRLLKYIGAGFGALFLAGRMDHQADSTEWSIGDDEITIYSEEYVSGLIPSGFIAEIIPFNWLFVDLFAGLTIPVDNRHEPGVHLTTGASLGVSILQRCAVRPYLRVGYLWVATFYLASLPNLSLGFRF